MASFTFNPAKEITTSFACPDFGSRCGDQGILEVGESEAEFCCRLEDCPLIAGRLALQAESMEK